MAHNIHIFYDDRAIAGPAIAAIVGLRRYGDILYRKAPLFTLVQDAAAQTGAAFHRICRDEDVALYSHALPAGTLLLYHRADAAVSNIEAYLHLLGKTGYAETTLADKQTHPQFAVFAAPSEGQAFFHQLLAGNEAAVKAEILTTHQALTDISTPSALLTLLSGIFETRHFNSVQGDDHTLIKSSADIVKIRREYRHHYALPEMLRYWFVPPFDYKEEAGRASYRMERIHLPNMAVRWVHGAFSPQEFSDFLEQAFHFLQQRPVRKAQDNSAPSGTQDLYFTKVETRYAELRAHPLFARLDSLIRSGVQEGGIDALMERYRILAKRLLGSGPDMLAISHGDFCFSNLLYDKHTGQLRLIDPKGADSADELWMDSYYDIAKLSHSILGNYDFLSQGLFSLNLKEDLQFVLHLASPNLEPLKLLFIERLRVQGYDPVRVRLCELSLFLSLLPLHTDNPRRMLAFLINAHAILKELEANV